MMECDHDLADVRLLNARISDEPCYPHSRQRRRKPEPIALSGTVVVREKQTHDVCK